MLYFAHLTMIMRFGLTLEIKRKLRNSVIAGMLGFKSRVKAIYNISLLMYIYLIDLTY